MTKHKKVKAWGLIVDETALPWFAGCTALYSTRAIARRMSKRLGGLVRPVEIRILPNRKAR